MSWLLIGLIPPILWAFANHIDKYLLSKAYHKSSVEVLMVYSTSFSIVVLPVTFYLARQEIFSNFNQIVVQLIGGVLITLSIYCYLIALNKDEASVVMPFALLVPVFSYIFSYFLLGEVLTLKQVISCLLIIGGSLILSLEFDEERKIKIKHGVLLFMVLTTVLQAAQETLFKFETINNSFVVSIFWMYSGILLTGLFLIIVKPGLFTDFIRSVRLNGKIILGLNIGAETISAVAYMVRDYTTLLAPVAVVATLNGYQPVFVFVLGIIFTIFLPKFVSERIKTVHLLHKGIAIGIMLAGTILISQTLLG